MLEIIAVILLNRFNHARCKSNCGNYGCDCDNMAESSSSSSSVPQAHHHHDEAK